MMMVRLAERRVRIEPRSSPSVAKLKHRAFLWCSPTDAGCRSTHYTLRLRNEIAEHLGCSVEEGRFGPIVTSETARMTTVAGVYAADDKARAKNALIASAAAAEVSIALHARLVFGVIL